MKMGDPANPGAPPENAAADSFAESRAGQYAATLPPPLQAPTPTLNTPFGVMPSNVAAFTKRLRSVRPRTGVASKHLS